MTEALKGNTKHEVLNPKQIQNPHDQMTNTFRPATRSSAEAHSKPPSTSSGPEFIEGLPSGLSLRVEDGRVDLGFGAKRL
jgi:hypothetical protein